MLNIQFKPKSTNSLSEKVAIVTGGTGALGRVIVNKLADNGVKVYVPVVSMEEFNKVFDSSLDTETYSSNLSSQSGSDSVSTINIPQKSFKLRKIFAFDCNAFSEDSVVDFVNNVAIQEKGTIDFLINTVGGIDPVTKVSALTTDLLNKMIDLNFKSTFYFTREALRFMEKNNYGRIISIGAIAGLNTSPGRFAYSMSKAGVINLMDTVSEEMKDKNIRCNVIVPSIIDTPANREWGSADDIKKWVKPEEIADMIADLVSPKFDSLRNSVLKVYGNF